MQTSDKTSSTASYGLNLAVGPTIPSPGGTDIIFIHGLGSTPATTWKCDSPDQRALKKKRRIFARSLPPDVCWVTDFLPNDLVEAGRKRDRIFFYNYDSQWYRNAVVAELNDFAHQMLDKISTLRDTPEARRRRLLFVAHCYGGLVVKKALQEAMEENSRYRDIADSTAGVIFLGTPHRGSNYVAGALFVASYRPLWAAAYKGVLRELLPESGKLNKLDEDFFYFLRSRRIPAVSYSEEKMIGKIGGYPLFWWRDVMVPKSESQLRIPKGHEGFVENLNLNLNHFELNKFDSSNNNNYKGICRKLIKMLKWRTNVVCMTPNNRVEIYTERAELSRQLDQVFNPSPDSAAGMQVAVLHGFGGTGKTQLVLDFAQRHKQDFDPILWVDATDLKTTKSSFLRCVTALDLTMQAKPRPSHDLNNHPAVLETHSYLRSKDGEDKQWLLVIDNADEEGKEYINSIMPDAQFGNVIVISRHAHVQSLPARYPRIEVRLLSQVEARKMVLTPLIRSANHEYFQQAIPLADALAKHAGYIALATDYLAFYVFQEELNGKPTDIDLTLTAALQKCLDDMELHKEEILDWPSNHSHYQKSIFQVWTHTMKAICRRYPSYVGKLFYFMTAFDTTSIEEELFLNASRAMPHLRHEKLLVAEWTPSWLLDMLNTKPGSETWDKFYFERAWKLLARYHLVTIDQISGQTKISIHKLVASQAKRVKQDAIAPYGYRYILFFAGIIHTLSGKDVIPSDDASYHSCARHFGQVQPIMLNREYDPIMKPEEARLWLLLAKLLQDMLRWNAAEAILSVMIWILKCYLPPDDEEILNASHDLAVCHFKQQNLDKAIDILKQVCPTKAEKFGAGHSSTSMSVLLLAGAYHSRGNKKTAFRLCSQVADYVQETYGLTHVETLIACTHVIDKALAIGDFPLAKEMSSISHTLAVFKYGEEDPRTLICLSNKARLCMREKDFDQAKQMFDKILEIRRKRNPPDHTYVLQTLDDLASYYEKIGDQSASDAMRQEIRKLKDERLKRFGWSDDEIELMNGTSGSESLVPKDKASA